MCLLPRRVENPQASVECEATCAKLINDIIRGDIVPCIDAAGHALAEYRNNMYPNPSDGLAGRFLMFLLLNKHNSERVFQVALRLNNNGSFIDYPDPDDTWTSDDPRCLRFHQDDKKWVALAIRFNKDTDLDAPIVNAADRGWLAFEPQLQAAGVKLETLCRPEREPIPALTPSPADAPA